MEFCMKLYHISSKIVYSNRDTYIYRTDVHNNKHPELEKIRSDIQQRMNFITFLAARKIDTTKYLYDFMMFLNDKRKIAIEQITDDATETIRWIDEILFLLEGENR